MMNNEVFRDTKAKYKLEEWYQIFLKKIDAPSESISVETSFGSNHVLRIGNPSKPVLLCFHSMLTSSAHLVSELQLLLNDYQMFAPDLPGQSVRGLEKRFSYKDNSFAEWILEIIDGLGLGKVNALGVSLGGCAILQFARIFPAKVNCLILFVPAGTILDFPQNNRSPDQNEL